MDLLDILKYDDLGEVICALDLDNKAIVEALHAKDEDNGKLAYDLLTSLCHFSSDGYALTLNILDTLKNDGITPREDHRRGLTFILDDLRSPGADIERQSSVISLINAVIMNSDKPSRIRNVLKELNVMDTIDKLRDAAASANISPMSTLSSNTSSSVDSATSGCHPLTSSDLGEQIREFDSLGDLYDLGDLVDPGEEADRSQSCSSCADIELDIGNHRDVFNAIMNKLTGRPEVAFLNILRHMLQIDTEDNVLCMNIWETLEKLAYGAKVMDTPLDAAKLIMLGNKQLTAAKYHFPKKDTCTCDCHNTDRSVPPSPAPMISTPAPPPPPPPPPMAPSLPSSFACPPAAPPPPPAPPLGQFMQTPSSVDGRTPIRPLPFTPPQPPTLVQTIRLAQQLTPTPKCKLRKLQWSKLHSTKVIGKRNVWTMVGNTCKDLSIDFDNMELLFTIDSSPHSDNRRNSISRSKEKLHLLDSKRSLNTNIFLRQFRQPNSHIIALITSANSSDIGAERLKGLLKILPESNEVETLRNYTDDVSKLDNAERFFKELILVEGYKLKIELMLIKEEFGQTMEYIKPAIDAILCTSKDLRESRKLQKIIYLILISGNFLNSGANNGDAVGFRLNSLLKLTETRSNKPRMNLMHYVTKHIEDTIPELLDFSESWCYLSEVSMYTMATLTSDFTEVKRNVQRATDIIKSITDPKYNSTFKPFFEFAKEEIIYMERDFKEMETSRIEMSDYFCEDQMTFKLEHCFKTIYNFVIRFKKAIQENKERLIQEQKITLRKKHLKLTIKDIPKRTVDQDSSSDVDKAIQSYKTDKSDKNYIEHRLKKRSIIPSEMGELLNVLSETDGELSNTITDQPLSQTHFRRTGSLNRRRRKTVTLSDHFDRERIIEQLASPLSPLVETKRPISLPEPEEKRVPLTLFDRRRHWTDRRAQSNVDAMSIGANVTTSPHSTAVYSMEDTIREVERNKEMCDEEVFTHNLPVAPPRRSRSITTPEKEAPPSSIDHHESPLKLHLTPNKDKGDTPTQRAMFEHSAGNWRSPHGDRTSPSPRNARSPSPGSLSPTHYDEGKEALDAWRRSRKNASELIETSTSTCRSPSSTSSSSHSSSTSSAVKCGLSRSNTLPHRWRADAADSPSHRFTAAKLTRLDSIKMTDGVVLAPSHRSEDDDSLSEKVDAFRSRQKSDLDISRLSRFQSLAKRFQEEDEDELNLFNKPTKRIIHSNNHNHNNNNNTVDHINEERPTSLCKSDCDSIVSARDEGFESTASQRTSMSSNVEIAVHGLANKSQTSQDFRSQTSLSTAQDSGVNYFACSIDSLVPKTADDTNTAEDEWITETFSVDHKVPNVVEEIPSPPKRTTSKVEMKSTPPPPSSMKTTPISQSKRSQKSSRLSTTPKSTSDVAAAVTARLSRPKRPSGITRHLSNRSLNSNEDTVGSLTTTRGKTTVRSSAHTGEIHKTTTPFVRGSSSRSTMPATVAKTSHKKPVHESTGKDKSPGEDIPPPPKRSSSIRLKPALPITHTTSDSKSPFKTDKSMAGFINRLSSPKKKLELPESSTSPATSSTTSAAAKTTSRSSSKPMNPRMRTASAESGSDKSFFKKIIDKRKSAPPIPVNVQPLKETDNNCQRSSVSRC